MIFKLQRFAEEAEVETPEVEETPEVDIDAKITAALDKYKAQLDADYKKRAKEAERLGKLSDEERQKAELENMSKELASQRAEFEREKLKYAAAKDVAQRGLPVEFTEYLLAEDSESTFERIKTFEKLYKKSIQDGVNEALKGKAPASSAKVEVNDKISRGFRDAIYSKKINI